jgi:hypothetical protein
MLAAANAPDAGRTVFNIPHLKAKIFYEFGGIQHPISLLLGLPYECAKTKYEATSGSVFARVDVAIAVLEHSKWTADVSYAAVGLPYECAHRLCWDPTFPGEICDQAHMQARARADVSDVLLQMAWRYGHVYDWEQRFHGEWLRAYNDTFDGRRDYPRAWDSCGIGLSVSMPKARLLEIAAGECPPDEQPGPSLTEPEIVRHILKH